MKMMYYASCQHSTERTELWSKNVAERRIVHMWLESAEKYLRAKIINYRNIDDSCDRDVWRELRLYDDICDCGHGSQQ